jgi:hypothetical protein
MATEVALTLVHDSTALWPESIMEVLTDSESTPHIAGCARSAYAHKGGHAVCGQRCRKRAAGALKAADARSASFGMLK